jgi:hypothetical protein
MLKARFIKRQLKRRSKIRNPPKRKTHVEKTELSKRLSKSVYATKAGTRI